MTYQAAVAQFRAGDDKELNRKVSVEAIASAAAAGARIAVLPECSMHASPDPTADIASAAEPLDGPFVTAIREAARSAQVAAVVGLTERVDGTTRPVNTIVAVDSDGGLLNVYRKVHLYDAFGNRESDRVSPAEITTPAVFDIDGIRWGMLTCYDLRFPEAARYLVDAGAMALALPAAWVAGPAKEDHWQTLVRARAIENTVYMAASGQTGPHCCGQSLIVDPMGTSLAAAGETPGVAAAPISVERVQEVRRTNPSLVNRRFRISPGTLTPR